MIKLRRIHDFQHSFLFSTQQGEFNAFYDCFLENDLDRIFRAVLWDDLVSTFGLKESDKDPWSIFSAQGKLAPTFL